MHVVGGHRGVVLLNGLWLPKWPELNKTSLCLMALSTVVRDMTKVKIYTNNLTLIINKMTLDQKHRK